MSWKLKACWRVIYNYWGNYTNITFLMSSLPPHFGNSTDPCASAGSRHPWSGGLIHRAECAQERARARKRQAALPSLFHCLAFVLFLASSSCEAKEDNFQNVTQFLQLMQLKFGSFSSLLWAPTQRKDPEPCWVLRTALPLQPCGSPPLSTAPLVCTALIYVYHLQATELRLAGKICLQMDFRSSDFKALTNLISPDRGALIAQYFHKNSLITLPLLWRVRARKPLEQLTLKYWVKLDFLSDRRRK